MPSPTGQGPPELLDEALRDDPARPLLTFYDDATDERSELSVLTFANWVAKTANLLHDDLAAEPGGTVSLDLPPHWQAAVWLQASWALGLHVVPPGAPADIAVLPYGHEVPRAAADVVALGLGPLGLPLRDATAPAATTVDFDREIHGHGDRFVPTARPDPGAPALTSGDRTFTGGDLVALARAQPALPPGARLLVTERLTGLSALLAGLLVPLAAGVTAVVVRHADPTRLPGRATQEGLVAGVTSATSPVPAWRPEAAHGVSVHLD